MIPMEFGLAFLTGLGGSVHCLGMCSGFALAVVRGGGRRHLLYQALYSSGRLLSYLFLGLLAGTLGQSLGIVVSLKMAQTSLTIVAGAIMIVMGLHMLNPGHVSRYLSLFTRYPSLPLQAKGTAGFLVTTLRALMPPAGPAQAFYLGLLNGMLPCPVVYAVLPAALATGSGAQGGLLMLTLGAGTLPMMLGVGVMGRSLIPSVAGLARIPALAVLVFGLVTIGRAFFLMGPGIHTGH